MFQYYSEKAQEYWIYNENTDKFDMYFHFYLQLFFSVFLPLWWGLMSWIIKMVYQLPLMAIVFGTIWYHSETVRTWFYISATVMMCVFIFLLFQIPFFRNQISVFSKLWKRRNKNFKLTAIEVTGTFNGIVTDYSVRINKVPGKRAIYTVLHPLTEEETEVQTSITFDNNIVNAPQTLSIYFDRHNPEKYLCEIEK